MRTVEREEQQPPSNVLLFYLVLLDQHKRTLAAIESTQQRFSVSSSGSMTDSAAVYLKIED
jgi:hypothetical protein